MELVIKSAILCAFCLSAVVKARNFSKSECPSLVCPKLDYCNCERDNSGCPEVTCYDLNLKSLTAVSNAINGSLYSLQIWTYKDSRLPTKFLNGKSVFILGINYATSLDELSEDTFGDLDTVMLYLHSNKNLKVIHQRALLPMKNLRSISITENRVLTNADLDLTSMRDLVAVELMGNNISHIKEPKFHTTVSPNDVVLYLSGNPLVCDCELKWIKKKEWEDSTYGACFVPETNRYKFIYQVQEEDFICLQRGNRKNEENGAGLVANTMHMTICITVLCLGILLD